MELTSEGECRMEELEVRVWRWGWVSEMTGLLLREEVGGKET